MAEGVLTLENYEVHLTDKIGHGGFGTVYKGKHTLQGTDIAVKQCVIPSDQHGFQAMKEVKNFQQLEKHPNIVHLFDFYYRNNAFWFIMEFCDAGDLTRYMKKAKPGLDEKLSVMYECASAVAYMHTRKNPVVHRDIKPANILLKRENQKTVVKVTDFGLSKIMEHDPAKNYKLTTHAGTPAFMAPELFLREKYTESVDVFSLGLVYLCLLNFQPGDRDLIPSLPAQTRIDQLIPVGLHMSHGINANKSSVTLVTENPNDDPMVISLKHLICKMTAGLAKDRPSMTEVKRELGQLAGCDSQLGDTSVTSSYTYVDSQFENHQQNVKEPAVSFKPPPIKQPSIDVKPTGDDEMDTLRKALDEVIKDQMLSTEEKPPETEKGKKNPYAGFLENMLEDKPTPKQVQAGDRVVIDPDEERVRLLQTEHGGFVEQMKRYLGMEGLVRDRYAHTCRVQFDDGQVWTMNPETLLPLGIVQTVPPDNGMFISDFNPIKTVTESMFKRYDIVTMPQDEELVRCLQNTHGGWNPKMKYCLGVKGIVNKVHSGGDVYVEFIDGNDWTINPELLLHVETMESQIEEGDFVMVHSDRAKVKRAQEEVANWNSDMGELLGKTGIVQSVEGGKALVGIRGIPLMWSFMALVLVAKREELHSAARRSQASSRSYSSLSSYH